MCTALILLPPTALAMSYKSVVLVTTLSWASAPNGHARSAAASAKAKLRRFTGMLPWREAPSSSEWVRPMWPDGERSLQKDAVAVLLTYPTRHHTFIAGDELRELAREPLQVARRGADRAFAGRRLLYVVV